MTLHINELIKDYIRDKEENKKLKEEIKWLKRQQYITHKFFLGVRRSQDWDAVYANYLREKILVDIDNLRCNLDELEEFEEVIKHNLEYEFSEIQSWFRFNKWIKHNGTIITWDKIEEEWSYNDNEKFITYDEFKSISWDEFKKRLKKF